MRYVKLTTKIFALAKREACGVAQRVLGRQRWRGELREAPAVWGTGQRKTCSLAEPATCCRFSIFLCTLDFDQVSGAAFVCWFFEDDSSRLCERLLDAKFGWYKLHETFWHLNTVLFQKFLRQFCCYISFFKEQFQRSPKVFVDIGAYCALAPRSTFRLFFRKALRGPRSPSRMFASSAASRGGQRPRRSIWIVSEWWNLKVILFFVSIFLHLVANMKFLTFMKNRPVQIVGNQPFDQTSAVKTSQQVTFGSMPWSPTSGTSCAHRRRWKNFHTEIGVQKVVVELRVVNFHVSTCFNHFSNCCIIRITWRWRVLKNTWIHWCVYVHA